MTRLTHKKPGPFVMILLDFTKLTHAYQALFISFQHATIHSSLFGYICSHDRRVTPAYIPYSLTPSLSILILVSKFPTPALK